ncbi:MAG: lysophospholipase [Lachnospiraceae bacterium]|nr:lysophospholipase [Lachnospiraceae bacterium]
MADRKRTVLCFGDSNTYGYDPRSFLEDRYPADIRWTGLLSAAGYHVIEAGMNGRTIPDSLPAFRLFENMVDRVPLDGCVLLMLGSNDLLLQGSPSAEAVAARMKAFLESEEERRQISRMGKRFVLLSPPALREGTWVLGADQIRESRKLGECYRKIAELFEFSFVDMTAEDLPLCFDGVHLSEEGHRRVAEKAIEVLEKIQAM